MSRRESSSSSDESGTTALCIICDEAAVGLGPYSRCHLCAKHLCVDVSDVEKLREKVDEQLRVYSQGGGGGASGGVVALTALGEDVEALQMKIGEHLQRTEERFEVVQRELDSFRSSVRGGLESLLEALRVCKRDMEDVASYKREVWTAKAAGDMNEVMVLAQSMELSVDDMDADFERAARLHREERECAEQQERHLRQLERLVGSLSCGVSSATELWRDVSVTARSEEIDAAVTAISEEINAAERERKMVPMVFSHEVKLDVQVTWVAVCSDTSGFVGYCSDRVVSADSVDDFSEALPEPCIIASFWPSKDHLLLLSVDGSRKLRCHCDIDWKSDIRGLHCDGKLVFIAQEEAVTVTDLSGGVVRRIVRELKGFGGIWGIGGNAASLFVSSGNKIGVLSKASGEMERVISLCEFPDADLESLAIDANCILVTDRKHNQVHRVRIDSQEVVASHPTERCGLNQFEWPSDVAVDSRGRVFVSEFVGQSVRAVAVEDGSLLWTVGVPGERGSGEGRLSGPSGLALVTGGGRSQLVVADWGNSRLVVLSG